MRLFQTTVTIPQRQVSTTTTTTQEEEEEVVISLVGSSTTLTMKTTTTTTTSRRCVREREAERMVQCIWHLLLFLLVVITVTIVPKGTTATTSNNNNNRNSFVRSLRILEGSPMGSTRYLGQVAAFGNPLNGSDGNNLTRTYNLMLPPDNAYLCEYPATFAALNDNETLAIRELVQTLNGYYPARQTIYQSPPTKTTTTKTTTTIMTTTMSPVALFVSLNGCSAEQKALMALQIKQWLIPSLELLIVYSTNSTAPDHQDVNQLLISLELDGTETTTTQKSTTNNNNKKKSGGSSSSSSNINSMATYIKQHPDHLNEYSIGLLYLPFQYATDLERRMNMVWKNGIDPRLLLNDNHKWSFSIEVSNYSLPYWMNNNNKNENEMGQTGGNMNGSTQNNNNNDKTPFRVWILSSFLVTCVVLFLLIITWGWKMKWLR